MEKKSLLTKEDIDMLQTWSEGYFYKIFYYLEDFVKNGVKKNLFTLEQAREDLDIALWYAYAGNNIDIYEYYYKVVNWMPYSEKKLKVLEHGITVMQQLCFIVMIWKKHISMHKKEYKKKLIIHGDG